ncbi:methyl-accepting chemotaxis protein [Bosea eneae]|uniref:Methyl-accepting chemotaxis protein n=1 Tax=Bosea eneae TaxID=151454 RepID=A0ABW0ITI2_9HYPH
MGEVERLRARFARLLIALLWANVALLLIGTPSGGPAQANLTAMGAALAIMGTLAWRIDRIGWVTRQVTSVVLVGQVMLLVYAFAGHPYQADLHMYFFAMLAVLAGWLDWRIFLPATLAITVHHLALSFVYSAGVFPGGGDLRRALLHGAIVTVQAGALSWIVWALRLAVEASERERSEAQTARAVADEARRDVAETTAQAASERRRMLHDLANEFERNIAAIARAVIASISSLRAASQQMRDGAAEVSQRSTAASEASRQSSSNVIAITAATSELADSFTEVDRQVNEASRLVGDTTQQALTVLDRVGDLSRKVHEIGNVTNVISTIARHTNLLALNASIEAARIGSMGGGFAVVAHEIKGLADETWRATEQIQSQIDAIGVSGADAVQAIDAMTATIETLNQISRAVAIVVEKQNVATAGIAENVRRAASETVTAGGHIDIVNRVAGETGEAAHHVADSADALARQSADLDTEVAQFLGRIRAA